MNSKCTFLVCLSAFVFCQTSAQAQEFSLAGVGAGSQRIATLNDERIVQPSSSHHVAVVSKLPKDYFASASAPSTPTLSGSEISASDTTANLLVIAALATMLCIGMIITGLCVMRRRPPSTPAQVLALRQRQLGISH